MKGSIEKTLIAGISVAIASILAIVLVSIWQFQRLQDTSTTIRHTNSVIYQTKEVLDISIRYELGVKNYLLTGDSMFLEPLDTLFDGLKGRIALLKNLTVDNPTQQRRISALYFYVDKNRLLLDRALQMSRSKDFEGAARLISGGASSGYSFQISSVSSQMEKEERRLLELRRAVNAKRIAALRIVLWVVLAVVVILATVIFKKIRVDLGKEKKRRDQLSRFNEELEAQVSRQTADLQASEEKYRSLFLLSPLPKWMYDQETLQFLEVNHAAIRNYGYTQEEFRNMTIKDIRPKEDEENLIQDVQEAILSDEPIRSSSWRHITKNGTVIDVEITAHSFDYDGRKARMVVVNDITERMNSERVLNRLNADLEKRAGELAASNAELERFAYIASHDLQEPLRMVSSFLQLLQKRYGSKLDEKADQYIHFAVDGAERMKTLIHDLLEYSRVGTAKENFSYVNMGEVMNEVGNIFREKIIESRASVEIDPLPVVFGDKVQLMQLLQNLIGNALKYHSDQPIVIRIRVVEERSFWKFSVQDNGIGIDPLFFDKIFIIFQRLHNKSDYSGTGIGLAICKKIVERHGGRIWVDSQPQQGSTFYFTIGK